MFRSRGENLRSVHVLLFLNVTFFLLEHQDARKFAGLFAFDRDAVAGGQLWRLLTYQFAQAGSGWVKALALFVTLLLLYLMGSAVEEAWGTFHFLTLYVLSSLASAGMAAVLDIPLLRSYFVYFTLLFVYATAFPRQSFYLAGVAIHSRVLAVASAAVLLYGVYVGGAANLAALAGSVTGYVYYLTQRKRAVPVAVPATAPSGPAAGAIQNAARFVAMKQVMAEGVPSELERLAIQCERDAVHGVNICPPADYKPESTDGYCIRCEGFAECAARHLRALTYSPD
ncbi:MAG: Rhomboid family [Acidobacteriota bacterium]|jgi:membrane associated rhomboid family serine protease|nr:Rhomboid family [Acidobacteriota bacterium]